MSVNPISCDLLTKRFGSIIALESVSFEVSQPGVIGLVGPNGSGKSTLLRLLMGAQKPSSGEIRLFGRPPRESRRRHTDVGYLSAADRMFPELTVLENMIYRGQLYGLDHQAGSTMSARLLRERDLYGLRDRRPDTLSTGQRRQISLLSTLMPQPRLLLLDEPTTGIDITAITQIYQLMSDLCERDTTIILCTHSIEELVTLCQRTLALHDGQLVHDGPTSQLGESRVEVRDSLQRLFLGSELPLRAPLARPDPVQPVEFTNELSLEEDGPSSNSLRSLPDVLDFTTEAPFRGSLRNGGQQ